jgi:hypothetical protein
LAYRNHLADSFCLAHSLGGTVMKMRDYGLMQHEWAELWDRFDEKFDGQDFQPRNKTQKRWIQQYVQEKLNFKLRRVEKFLEQMELKEVEAP